MTQNPEDLFRRLDALGIETTTHPHPEVMTVEENKAVRGAIPGRHCKNLFLKDKKGALFLVVAAEDRDVDLKALRRLLGAQTLSFGKAELLRDVLGIEPGAVTPFALINDTGGRVRVVLDADMMTADVVNYHPLVNTATTSISPADLLAFIRDCGHEPEIVTL